MKKMKRVVALMLSICAIFATENICYASEEIEEIQYLENHYQVNFNDLNVYVVDGEKLVMEPSESVSVWSRRNVSNEISMLEETIKENPAVADVIIEGLESKEELMAISVSEAPIIWTEDHYERVPQNKARAYQIGETSTKGKFSLYTVVKRANKANSNGTYDYTTTTYGSWSVNSPVGGSSYPASGEDYMLQSTPNNWVRKSRSMTASYDDGVAGIQGQEYWFCSGGSNYIKCAIMDDPLGWRQNTICNLSCVSAGKVSTSYRMINSYYVHTWADIDVSVSVSASTDQKVGLTITPSIVNKSWTLYNSVTFNF